MQSKTLPEGPLVPMAKEVLAPLLRDALLAAHRALAQMKPAADEWLVFRPTSDGFESARLGAPGYRATPGIFGKDCAASRSREAKALTDYFWAHGAFRVPITRDDDQEPTQEHWASYPWNEAVLQPLWGLLNLAAVEDLVERGEFEPWRLDERCLDQAVADLVDQLTTGHCTVTAIGPAHTLKAEDGPFELEGGLVLEPWSPKSRAVFLTRNHQQYLIEDTRPWTSAARISIQTRVPVSDGGLAANEAVAAKLDRLKWAIMIVLGGTEPIHESPVAIRSPSGARFPTLRRGEGPATTSRIYTVHYIGSTEAERIRSLLERLSNVSRLSSDFGAVLAAFGRSCSAQRSIDILVEAAIGLEMLLLYGAGESTYKFALHGLALLSDEPPDDLHEEMKEIYRMRSTAVHGDSGSTKAGKVNAVATRARLLLAKAVLAVIELTESGELDLKGAKGDVGSAVTTLVRNRVRRHPT